MPTKFPSSSGCCEWGLLQARRGERALRRAHGEARLGQRCAHRLTRTSFSGWRGSRLEPARAHKHGPALPKQGCLKGLQGLSAPSASCLMDGCTTIQCFGGCADSTIRACIRKLLLRFLTM